jgi:hypothetical protein
MRKFKSQGQAHRFLSRHGVLTIYFGLVANLQNRAITDFYVTVPKITLHAFT